MPVRPKGLRPRLPGAHAGARGAGPAGDQLVRDHGDREQRDRRSVVLPGDSEPWGVDELASAALVGTPQVVANWASSLAGKVGNAMTGTEAFDEFHWTDAFKASTWRGRPWGAPRKPHKLPGKSSYPDAVPDQYFR